MNIVGEVHWHLGDDAAVLKFSESDEAFSIDLVMVPAMNRGRGIGSTLVRHVLTLADAMGKNVHVAARPVPCSDQKRLERLEEFYTRFGFHVVDRGETATYMMRQPAGASPPSR